MILPCRRILRRSIVSTVALSLTLNTCATASAPQAAPSHTGSAAPCTPMTDGEDAVADQDGDGKPESLLSCRWDDAPSEVSAGDRYPDLPCMQVRVKLSKDGALGAVLAAYCPGPHGARGVGADAVEVETGRLVQTQSGGSSWAWTMRCVLGLDPLRLAARVDENEWLSSAGVNSTVHVDLVKMRAHIRHSTRMCTTTGDEGEIVQGSFFTIPTVSGAAPSPSEAFLVGAFPCPLALHSGESSMKARGEASDPTDSSMQVGAWDDGSTLVVRLEASDDVRVTAPTGAAATWLATDHAELWLAPSPPPVGAQCLDAADRAGVHQWALVADGGTTRVERTVGTDWMIAGTGTWTEKTYQAEWRLTDAPRLAALHGGITLVYSDSDDGKSQEHLLATSALRFRDPASFGRLGPPPCVSPAGSYGIGPLVDLPLAIAPTAVPSTCLGILRP